MFIQFSADEIIDVTWVECNLYLLQANHSLWDEIREINKQLIETVVDISDEEADLTAEEAAAKGDGTVVMCSFTAVALSPDLRSRYESAQLVSFKCLKFSSFTNHICNLYFHT